MMALLRACAYYTLLFGRLASSLFMTFSDGSWGVRNNCVAWLTGLALGLSEANYKSELGVYDGAGGGMNAANGCIF